MKEKKEKLKGLLYKFRKKSWQRKSICQIPGIVLRLLLLWENRLRRQNSETVNRIKSLSG